MDCLKNYIHPFKGFEKTPPKSGRYLNEVSGIIFERFEDITEAEQLDFTGVWDDLQKQAQDNFNEDLILEFEKVYKLEKLLQSVSLGNEIDKNSLTAFSETTKRGLIIELFEKGSSCIGSNLSSIYIQDLNFYFNGIVPYSYVKIEFVNAETLETEFSISENVNSNSWNNISVNRKFEAKRLFVFVSGNMENFVKQDISVFGLSGFNSTQLNGWGYFDGALNYAGVGCGTSARIQGVEFNTENQTYSTNTNVFGLSARVSVNCSFENIICRNKKHFLSAWQNCLAIEFFTQVLNSSRLNSTTTIEKDEAQKRKNELIEMYPKKLYAAVNGIDLNMNDGCIRGNYPIRLSEVML